MGAKRGRKSAGDLSAVSAVPQRPEPFAYLTKEQKDIWRRITEGLPVDWFRPETLDLLARYCEGMANSRKLQRMLEALPDDAPIADIERIMRLKEKCDARLVTLATKMRLSQQTSRIRESSKNPAHRPASVPWANLARG